MTEEERNFNLQTAFNFEYNKYAPFLGESVLVDEFDPDVKKWTFGVKITYEDISESPTKVEDFAGDLGTFCAGFIAGSLGTNTHVGVRYPWTVEALDEYDIASVIVKVRGRFKFYTPESEKE